MYIYIEGREYYTKIARTTDSPSDATIFIRVSRLRDSRLTVRHASGESSTLAAQRAISASNPVQRSQLSAVRSPGPTVIIPRVLGNNHRTEVSSSGRIVGDRFLEGRFAEEATICARHSAPLSCLLAERALRNTCAAKDASRESRKLNKVRLPLALPHDCLIPLSLHEVFVIILRFLPPPIRPYRSSPSSLSVPFSSSSLINSRSVIRAHRSRVKVKTER